MEKLLSISIAAYNVERYLQHTLESLVSSEILDDIEVLIVDDGSKDRTAEIGKKFEARYPNSFRVISKPNGGYGSTINAAVDAARGLYFKTLDGDDWFDTEQFTAFVKALRQMDADMVITPFTMVHEDTGERELISCGRKHQSENILFDHLPKEIYPYIRMHGIAYRTVLLKEHQIRIGEHCFYTDIEYIAFPIVFVQTVNFLDYSVYQYRLGLEGQSVSLKGFRKHYKDHLRVTQRMLQFYQERRAAGLSKEKDQFLFEILAGLVEMQIRIFFVLENSPQTKQEFQSFDQFLKEQNPELYASVPGKKIALLRKSNFKLLGLMKAYCKNKL